MYAIIEESGKQFKVTIGDVIRIDRHLDDSVDTMAFYSDKTLIFDRVLLVAGEGSPKVGQPVVAGATVFADVLGQVKGKKIESVKYKRRKGFHKTIGHRQKYTSVKITAINA